MKAEILNKKLVYKRMLVIFAPILFSFVIAIFLYIATSKIQNRNEEIEWNVIGI